MTDSLNAVSGFDMYIVMPADVSVSLFLIHVRRFTLSESLYVRAPNEMCTNTRPALASSASSIATQLLVPLPATSKRVSSIPLSHLYHSSSDVIMPIWLLDSDTIFWNVSSLLLSSVPNWPSDDADDDDTNGEVEMMEGQDGAPGTAAFGRVFVILVERGGQCAGRLHYRTKNEE